MVVIKCVFFILIVPSWCYTFIGLAVPGSIVLNWVFRIFRNSLCRPYYEVSKPDNIQGVNGMEMCYGYYPLTAWNVTIYMAIQHGRSLRSLNAARAPRIASLGGSTQSWDSFPGSSVLDILNLFSNRIVVIVVDGEPDPDWMCGGVLVTDQHVVTAAHCVANLDIGYQLEYIRMGEHNTETDPDCQLSVCAPKVQDRKPKFIKKHELFNKPSFHNDIAIIVLDSPVELHDYVSPICLPRSAEQRAELPLGEHLTVAGWGKMNMTTEERAHILQFVTIPVVDPETCNMFGKTFELARSQICAGAQHNKDACGGDSGGPAMKVFDGVEGPKNVLMGVVSFGPTICGIRKPGVYSSTAFHLKWILDNIM